MLETVTVNEAIKKGQWMINYPAAAIILGTIVLSFFLSGQNYIPLYALWITIPAGIILGWLYWSFSVTKWRLWAFENVRNVHELQRKAIEAKLISTDGSFSERTEIRSAADKEKWASLQSKFDLKDVYIEDTSLPTEALIYYSKGTISLTIGFMILVMGFGIYLFLTHVYLGACIACGAAVFFIYTEVKKVTNKDPQIILNSKGIETVSSGFVAWNDVQDDEVITRSTGKTSTTYLEYNYPAGSVQLSIAELDTNKTALENMLHTYRVRSEKRASGKQQFNNS